MKYIETKGDAAIIRLHIQPRASRSEIAGIHGDRLKVRLKSPPVNGKANEELIALLSALLDIPKSGIEIVHGATGRDKTVKVTGITKEKLKTLHAYLVER